MSYENKKVISVNNGAARKIAEDYWLGVIDELCDKMLKIIRDEIPLYGDAPGRTQWREELREQFKKLYVGVDGKYVIGRVGAIFPAMREYIIAMLVDQGHNEDGLWTKPGELTYTTDMRITHEGEPHISSAKTRYRMPWFEQKGTDFMKNAEERISRDWDRQVEAAIHNFPINEILKTIRIKDK